MIVRKSSLTLIALALAACPSLAAAPAFAASPVAPAPQGFAASPAPGPQGLPPAAAASGEVYRIHVGDQIAVTVAGEQNPTQVLKVVRGGTISYPLVGSVNVAGLTPNEASGVMERALTKYMRHPVVTIGVVQEGQIEVLVLGNVKAPNKYLISSQGRLYDAIAAAGGLGPTDGDLPMARIGTSDGKVSQYSLQKLLQEGDLSQNAALPDQATVYVESPATFLVRVVGDVSRGGDVQVHEGEHLSAAVARAGPTQTADLNRITLSRTDADGKKSVQTVDLYAILNKGEYDKDVAMQKGDFIGIPMASGHSDTVSKPFGLLYTLGRVFGLPF